jgi:hypothetical protein
VKHSNRSRNGAKLAQFLTVCVLCVFPGDLSAQITGGRVDRLDTKGPVRPAPRLPDGRPDLGNGKGSWNPRIIQNIAGVGPGAPRRTPVEKVIEVPFQPWAKALYEERIATIQLHDPESLCLPPGIPRMYHTPFPFQIYQFPDRVLFIFEGGAHIWRIVYTDGREHPQEPNLTFLGDSVGHWEGDTLVVDTVGFNEMTWLDQDGHPHTDAMHTIERFTRTNETTLHYQVTIEDPKTYTAPWTTSYTIPWSAGMEPLEYICQENNKDLVHMVGK